MKRKSETNLVSIFGYVLFKYKMLQRETVTLRHSEDCGVTNIRTLTSMHAVIFLNGSGSVQIFMNQSDICSKARVKYV